MSNTVKLIAGILTVAAFVALCFKIDLRWTKTEVHAKDVATLTNKVAFLEQSQKQQLEFGRGQKLQERIWELEKWYRGKRMPDPVQKEILYHQEEIKKIYEEKEPVTPAPPGSVGAQ